MLLAVQVLGKNYKVRPKKEVDGAPRSFAKRLDELLERSELLLVDQLELVHEEDKVLEGGVEVRLLAEGADLRRVRMVDVSIDTEEALEDVLHDARERLGERNAYIQ